MWIMWLVGLHPVIGKKLHANIIMMVGGHFCMCLGFLRTVLNLKNSLRTKNLGLDLEKVWPWPWPWPQRLGLVICN